MEDVMGFLVLCFGIVALLLGVFFFVAAAMPAFGGRNDAVGSMVAGYIIFVVGICLCFYAGSWL